MTAALRSLDLLVTMDLFVNETAKYAHVVLPGTSFLEKDGTFTNAERRINRVRPVMPPRTGKHEWQVICEIAQAMGYDVHYDSAAAIMDEVAATTPTFAGVSFKLLDEVGSVQWPCNPAAPLGTPVMHVGTQTRRTANVAWHDEDVLDIHPVDAEVRGINDGDAVRLSSRIGETTLHARLSDRMQMGVVYTTFHHPVSGANVVTTENSDWATNCPEYKVTAVQVAVVTAAESAGLVTAGASADGGAPHRDAGERRIIGQGERVGSRASRS
jgi:formate dehydrogenase major subunit